MVTDNHQLLFAERALLIDGWAEDVVFAVDVDGRIVSIERQADAGDAKRLGGPVIPAVANLHSHAFQRAMAGLTDVAGQGDDSFWTWREEMYRLVSLLTPDDVVAIAAKLQMELLKGGFGRVAEFHYLHHGPDGRPYGEPADMSLAMLRAAEQSGIGLTLLPVFYAHSDFGGAAPTAGQRRFIHDVDGFLTLLHGLVEPCRAIGARLGLAFHSLRAVTGDEIAAIMKAVPEHAPIHIHVAEQEGEVSASLAHSGRRPVERLYDMADVDERWCLVHATHVTDVEMAMIAGSGAVVGLCPTTEADLGDGIFPGSDFLSVDGRFGIGTDSHVATSVADELRLLEYGQRLRERRRNRMAGRPGASVGRTLFDRALAGGAQAAGVAGDGLSEGAPADLVVLDDRSPYLASVDGDAILDRWIFGGLGPVVRDVMIGGRWLVEDGRHPEEEKIDRAFGAALARLRA
ncbi:formimidoylglutamate deiminase [Pleomorphomonas sp. JP5]|uniref:formimidoylglutamate deiminase n=1 Tax=Pleomorphomonas sp. JP5 TaxID=2942998 RepID=UPI002043A864|nr:formimidoylglutamate deiminase [Pleomorphomonas sp. JP5]MCM5560216.1 formimidoylglutamate deiminase [Pleomorphomonas sp. JP5]